MREEIRITIRITNGKFEREKCEMRQRCARSFVCKVDFRPRLC
jgi:hypothetical protein